MIFSTTWHLKIIYLSYSFFILNKSLNLFDSIKITTDFITSRGLILFCIPCIRYLTFYIVLSSWYIRKTQVNFSLYSFNFFMNVLNIWTDSSFDLTWVTFSTTTSIRSTEITRFWGKKKIFFCMKSLLSWTQYKSKIKTITF